MDATSEGAAIGDLVAGSMMVDWDTWDTVSQNHLADWRIMIEGVFELKLPSHGQMQQQC